MSWEETRSWHLMRPLVYYLRDDLVAPELAFDKDILDFSAGTGDLAAYLIDAGARSVIATSPAELVPVGGEGITWIGDVAAGNLGERLPPAAFDLAIARMVFQFPTWEGDRADPDTMVEEFARVLRPGGRLIVAFHQFIPFEDLPAAEDYPGVDELLAKATGRRERLARVVRYLGLPPREGPLGETGFGLKVPMLVTTLQTHGFQVETADHPEPFTFPLIDRSLSDEDVAALGEEVMALKGRYLSGPNQSPYDRPAAMKAMLDELGDLLDFVAWPIVRVVARLSDRAF